MKTDVSPDNVFRRRKLRVVGIVVLAVLGLAALGVITLEWSHIMAMLAAVIGL